MPALAADDIDERLLRHDPVLGSEYRTAVSTEAEDTYRIEGKACFERGTPSDIRDCLTRARTQKTDATGAVMHLIEHDVAKDRLIDPSWHAAA
jgi:hypothetical protein